MIALAFAEWILRSGYRPVEVSRGVNEWGAPNGGTTMTTIQLYSVYLNSMKDAERHTQSTTPVH